MRRSSSLGPLVCEGAHDGSRDSTVACATIACNREAVLSSWWRAARSAASLARRCATRSCTFSRYTDSLICWVGSQELPKSFVNMASDGTPNRRKSSSMASSREAVPCPLVSTIRNSTMLSNLTGMSLACWKEKVRKQSRKFVQHSPGLRSRVLSMCARQSTSVITPASVSTTGHTLSLLGSCGARSRGWRGLMVGGCCASRLLHESAQCVVTIRCGHVWVQAWISLRCVCVGGMR
mmetsp:Transcript_13020/g.26015  ORF Transcript_13020/g.26015 Transcript_13020/m.26015 type:complete len:236 (+) Transcript_13020:158-865(+)